MVKKLGGPLPVRPKCAYKEPREQFDEDMLLAKEAMLDKLVELGVQDKKVYEKAITQLVEDRPDLIATLTYLGLMERESD